jgi:hypothetical protein
MMKESLVESILEVRGLWSGI